MYRSLSIRGNVIGAPDRIRTGEYSWPMGKPVDQVREITEAFGKAFNNVTFSYTTMN